MGRKSKILYWLGVVLVLVAARTGAAGELLGPVDSVSKTGSSAGSVRPAGIGPNRPAGVPAETQEGKVARIVDGDTIRVAIDRPGGSVPVGRDHRIRILQIDTPETVRPNYPVQCAGQDATAFARAELPVGSTVYLLADREDKDRFGRYLRYVWDFEGEFYNEKAVARGLARAVVYPPNELYAVRIRKAEAAANRDRRGLWGEACTGAQ